MWPERFSGHNNLVKINLVKINLVKINEMKSLIVLFFITILTIFFSGVVEADLPPAAEDVAGVRVFSIGDIHGGLRELTLALEAVGLYSSVTKQWTGGRNRLVLMGDLINRGPHSREVMDFVMKLERQAEQAGGRLHPLLGNHELIATLGNMNYAHANDGRAFLSLRSSLAETPTDIYKNAFRGDSRYAKWFRSRKAVVRINSTLFVHAGLDSKTVNFSIAQINEMVAEWFRYHQGVGPEPPQDTEWVISGRGPLWTRTFAEPLLSNHLRNDRAQMTMAELDLLLLHFGVRRVAVGHSVIPSLDIAVNHPAFGEKVIMTDTDISAPKGILSVFEYNEEGVIAYQIDPQSGAVVKTLKTARNARSCRGLFH